MAMNLLNCMQYLWWVLTALAALWSLACFWILVISKDAFEYRKSYKEWGSECLVATMVVLLYMNRWGVLPKKCEDVIVSIIKWTDFVQLCFLNTLLRYNYIQRGCVAKPPFIFRLSFFLVEISSQMKKCALLGGAVRSFPGLLNMFSCFSRLVSAYFLSYNTMPSARIIRLMPSAEQNWRHPCYC